MLEKAVYTRVYQFLEKHDILYNSQYGFRNKRSCQQAILEMVGQVLQAHNNGNHSASLFLDFSKAFDSLEHSILLNKKAVGFMAQLMKLCKQHLSCLRRCFCFSS